MKHARSAFHHRLALASLLCWSSAARPVAAANYPDFTAFTFDTPAALDGIITNWYGAPDFVQWSAEDAGGSTNSGSACVLGAFVTNDNNVVWALTFDHGYDFPHTNWIDARLYTNVELDVRWDAARSTVDLAEFNLRGDIGGFPLGLLVNGSGSSFGQREAFGANATPIPNAASNGWVHLNLPLNTQTPDIDHTVGLWFKKFNGGNTAGTVAFWIDHVVFNGGPIGGVRPALTLSTPVRGLHCAVTGQSLSGPYERESLVTFDRNYTFVDQPGSVTYSMNIAQFRAAGTADCRARIMLLPAAAAVIDPYPDWSQPTMLVLDLRYQGTNAEAQLLCKTNDSSSLPAADGAPTFDTPGNIEGNWTFTFSRNTNVVVTAPSGASATLPFPLGLNSNQVSQIFGSDLVVYFGAMMNDGRVVIASAGITNGSTTLLWDEFASDAELDLNTIGIPGAGKWLRASASSTPERGVFLIGPDSTTKFFLEWPAPATGFMLETNGVLTASAGWSTNTGLIPILCGTRLHADVDATNLPPTGPLFFRLARPGP